MRAAVNVLGLLAGATLLAAAAPGGTAAGQEEGSGQEGASRWVPSLAVTSGITIQPWKGSAESEICQGCTLPSPMAEVLQPSASGNDLDVTPFVGGEIELMTPELPVRTSPRLFVGGGLAGAFGSKRRVASQGDAGELRSPLPAGQEGAADFSENAVLGQGSTTTAQLGSLVYGAQAGVAFPLELFEHPFRLKLSLAWIRFQVDAKGLTADAECERVGNTTQCNELRPPGFLRDITLSDKASETFDGLGPRLDLEMDTGRFGPLGTSLFLGGSAYGLLGNRKIELRASQAFPDTGLPGLGAADTAAAWNFEVDPWVYRVAIGIRFQFIGSSK